jgi:aspartyl-tRNA(Asn)/glutamyl-tRNA(Gln) amidotransferase subunit C
MKLPWREDVVSDGGIQEKVLKNAPQSDYGCFVVPKVIDQG